MAYILSGSWHVSTASLPLSLAPTNSPVYWIEAPKWSLYSQSLYTHLLTASILLTSLSLFTKPFWLDHFSPAQAFTHSTCLACASDFTPPLLLLFYGNSISTTLSFGVCDKLMDCATVQTFIGRAEMFCVAISLLLVADLDRKKADLLCYCFKHWARGMGLVEPSIVCSSHSMCRRCLLANQPAGQLFKGGQLKLVRTFSIEQWLFVRKWLLCGHYDTTTRK